MGWDHYDKPVYIGDKPVKLPAWSVVILVTILGGIISGVFVAGEIYISVQDVKIRMENFESRIQSLEREKRKQYESQ